MVVRYSKLFSIVAVFLAFTVWSTITLADSVEEDIGWCFSSSADSSMQHQAEVHPVSACMAIWAGSVVIGAPIDGVQRDWVQKAPALACSPLPQDQAAAINLIGACQCHDGGRWDRVMNQANTVLHVLRQRQGCDGAGIPLYF